MTDVLQVMDLVVNSPVKAGVRRDRTRSLFNYFQSWIIDRLKAAIDPSKPIPAFAPPKPKVSDGIFNLLAVCNSTFVDKSFIASLEKCFQDCCIAPIAVTETNKEYKVYRSHKHGSMAKSFLMSVKLGQQCAHLHVNLALVFDFL